jgi:hypothetical protein
MLDELDLYRAKKAIRELAKAKGIDEKEMRLEMEKAIEMGFSNPNPSIRQLWNASPFRDVQPSPEEFILWCASQL